MARKGRDLFEVLRERSSGSGGVRAASSRKSAQSGAVGSELAKVGRDVAGWVKRKVGAEPPPEPERPAHSGMILAAVAAGALLLGFVVGRLTSGTPEMTPELRRSDQAYQESGEPEGAVPGWVRRGDEVAADPAEAEKVLSTLGYLLLVYSALERQEASDLAVWLRATGLPDTRIRSLTRDSDGSDVVAVICYTSPGQAETDLATLRRLQAPDFAPVLAEALSEITEPIDVTFKR